VSFCLGWEFGEQKARKSRGDATKNKTNFQEKTKRGEKALKAQHILRARIRAYGTIASKKSKRGKREGQNGN